MISFFVLFLAALFFLRAVSVRAYWIQLSNQSLNPAFSLEQYRPAADGGRPGPGRPPLPVEITILPLPPGWPPEIGEAIRRSVESWSGVKGSALVMTVSESAGGEADSWNWEMRYSAADGRNTIEFVREGWTRFWSPNTIAFTAPHLDENGVIREADIFCNAQYFRWVVFPREGSFPRLAAENRLDVEALITHELGHVVGLGHSQYPWASMYWLVGVADTRARTLSRDDEEGLRALYPATAGDIPPPSIWGVHEDNFPTLDCGMSTLSLLSAQIAYVDRGSPLIGPHEMISDTTPEFHYCLFGSGFNNSAFQSLDLAHGATAMNTVTGAEFISRNFVRGVIKNGSGGFPPLPPAAYDLTALQLPGGTGSLDQGLFVNYLGNGVPQALIVPEKDQVLPRLWVTLDGSDSLDPDLDPLSYKWSVQEKPKGAVALLSSDTAPVTQFFPSRPGLYVVRLVVNDGTLDGIADQVVLRASYSQSDADAGSDFRPFGCQLSAGRRSSVPAAENPLFCRLSILTLALPLLLGLFLRRRGRRPR